MYYDRVGGGEAVVFLDKEALVRGLCMRVVVMIQSVDYVLSAWYYWRNVELNAARGLLIPTHSTDTITRISEMVADISRWS